MTMNKNPVVLAMNVGYMGEPTTLCSVFPLPGNWVCFCLTSKPRCAASRPMMYQGHDQHVEDEEPGDDHPVARDSCPRTRRRPGSCPTRGIDSMIE